MSSPTINELIGDFKEKSLLNKFRASEQLLQRGEEAWFALLEALESRVKSIREFAAATLIWAKDPSLVPLLVERMGMEEESEVLLHPMYRVLLGYGEIIVPAIIENLDRGKSFPRLLAAVEEVMGSSPPLVRGEETEMAVEFEKFLKELHCTMAIPTESVKTLRRLKKWWNRNVQDLPPVFDTSFLENFFDTPLNYIKKEKKKPWKHWWSENKSNIERYISEAYLEAVMEGMAADLEVVAKEGETRWSETLEEGTSPFVFLPQHEETLPQPENLKLQWLSYWREYKEDREKSDGDPEAQLHQAFWHLKCDNYRRTVEILNKVAMERLLGSRRGPLPKSQSTLLKGMAEEVSDLFAYLVDMATDYGSSVGRLIFALNLELLGRREEAMEYLQEEVLLEGPASEWWFTVYYYKEQALARIFYSKRKYRESLLYLDRSLEVAKNVLLLRRSLLADSLPHPLQLVAQQVMERQSLPPVGRELSLLYHLKYKFLQSWNRSTQR